MAGRFHTTSRASLALALGLTLSTTAFADPWNGFYVGASAGGAWGSGDFATSAGEVTASSYFSDERNIAFIERDTSGRSRSSAFSGGLQLGANQRFNQIVFGAEIDFGAFDLNGSRSGAGVPYHNFPNLLYTASASYSTDWLLTGRGRLGWLATPNTLLYFTGGLALSDVKASNNFFDKSAITGIILARGASSNTRTKAGYTLGGGVEASLWGPWSIKAEYLYVDLGKVSTSGIIVPPVGPTRSPLDTSVDLTANIARVGINYSFGN